MKPLLLIPIVPLAALALASVDTADRWQEEPWVALSTSADERVVHIQGRGGGCGNDPRATLSETATTVTIRVQQRLTGAAGCPAMARIDDLHVRLSAPLDGRALIGQTLRDAAVGLDGPPAVPHVVGMRAEDARFTLRAQGFRARGVEDGTVRSQAHANGTVTLAGPIHPIPPLKPVRFRTVAKGDLGNALGERTGRVVRTERRWRELWRELTAGAMPRRKLPRIDFEREMLLLVTQGPRPANGVDQIRIVDVGDTGLSFQVRVEEITSAKGCNVSDVHMQPYHVVRVRAVPERVHFSREREVPPCVRDDEQRP
jgi:hypothetical protein